jgi:lipoprotein-anchoring transpeptidase ErfK/SrfK
VRRWRRRGPLLVLGAVIVAVAAVGAYLGTRSPSPVVSSQAGTGTQGLQLSFTPANGAGAVALDAPVGVTAAGGHLDSVSVTGPAGQAVPGSLAGGGKDWTSAPGGLAPASLYTIAVRGHSASGRAVSAQASFTTLTPTSVLSDDIEPSAGVVGVGEPIVVRFNQAVVDRAAVQRALGVQLSAPVSGAWHWLDAKEVHFRPQAYWPTGEHVTVLSDLDGVQAAPGLWGVTSRSVSFSVGDAHISTVDINSHMMTVTDNGAVVQTFKDSAGRDKYPTMGGLHVVLGKEPDVLMDSQSVGIPRDSPDGYYEHVAEDVNISDGGEFVHSAPWSVGQQGNSNVSHGCVNLAPSDATWFYNFSQSGDIVNIVNSPRPPETGDHGTADWNMSWAQWVAGSALPV